MMSGLIWREKPDGTRALAYPVYLAGALAAWGVIYALHARFMPEAPARPRHARRRGADVGAITGAAALAAPVVAAAAPMQPESRSFRLDRPAAAARHARPARTESDADDASVEDPLGEALRSPPAPADPTADGFAALTPALPPEPDGEGGGRLPRPQLLGYRDAAADSGADSGMNAASASPPFLSRGALIPVYLLTRVDTSNPAAVLQFAVAQDVVSHGLCRLRFGTRLLGKLEGRPLRDRLTLTVDTVLYPDGREEPIAATAVEADDRGSDIRPGVAAAFVPAPAWAQTAPYLAQFATGFLGLLQSRAQQGLNVGFGGVTLASTVSGDAKGPAYQASAQAIGDFTRARLLEWADRYAAYDTIPAGTACWLQLDADFAGRLSHAP